MTRECPECGAWVEPEDGGLKPHHRPTDLIWCTNPKPGLKLRLKPSDQR